MNLAEITLQKLKNAGIVSQAATVSPAAVAAAAAHSVLGPAPAGQTINQILTAPSPYFNPFGAPAPLELVAAPTPYKLYAGVALGAVALVGLVLLMRGR